MSKLPLPRWLRLSLGLALVASTAACAPAFFAPTHGRVALTVRWPQRAARFQVLAIPEGTALIRVTIRGEGIPDGAPLQATLTPDGGEESTQFLHVPVGPKYVEATALDPRGVATATGRQAIAVRPNALVEARLVLEPLAPGPAPTPSPGTEPPASGTLVVPVDSPVPAVPGLVIVTAAGDGVAGARDAKDPLAARFRRPRSLLYDAKGQCLYVTDAGYKLIRRFDLQTGAVTTVAGRAETESTAASGVPPALAGGEPGLPSGLALGPDGSLYFCDRDNHMIRMISRAGLVTTVAGTGYLGYADGAAATAQFAYPSDLAVDARGALYVADTHNNRIRKIEGGKVTTVAGAGSSLSAEAKGLKLPDPDRGLPLAIALDPAGASLYVAEAKAHRVSRLVLETGVVQRVVGSGRVGLAGEGGPALEADVSLPVSLAFEPGGALLVADGWACETGAETLTGAASRVLRVGTDGRLVRVAGSLRGGAYGFSGDGGDPLLAELNNPSGLAVDAGGRLFVADTFNNRIRVVRPVPLVTATPSPLAPPPGEPSPSPAATARPPVPSPVVGPTSTPGLASPSPGGSPSARPQR